MHITEPFVPLWGCKCEHACNTLRHSSLALAQTGIKGISFRFTHRPLPFNTSLSIYALS